MRARGCVFIIMSSTANKGHFSYTTTTLRFALLSYLVSFWRLKCHSSLSGPRTYLKSLLSLYHNSQEASDEGPHNHCSSSEVGNSVLPSAKRKNSGIKVCLHLVIAAFCLHVLLEHKHQQITETKVFRILPAGWFPPELAWP